ncbi:MAG: GNAT family N-acetyltransferase [Bacteroidetes bacterium]|nr:GNAT family N-acetyltransferase [Bacteroidota bacterium]
MQFPFEKEIVLEDAVALLRPARAEDATALLDVAIRDKDLLQYSPKPIHTPELLRAYMDRAVAMRKRHERYTFTVFDKRRNAFAGSTSFLNISDPDDRLEIGATWYGKEFQRTGLNRHCKYLLMDFAFGELGAERVEFRTDERNQASRRAIEGIGGRFEGMLRHHMLMHDGFRRNTVCYGMLRPEWEEVKWNLLH